MAEVEAWVMVFCCTTPADPLRQKGFKVQHPWSGTCPNCGAIYGVKRLQLMRFQAAETITLAGSDDKWAP